MCEIVTFSVMNNGEVFFDPVEHSHTNIYKKCIARPLPEPLISDVLTQEIVENAVERFSNRLRYRRYLDGEITPLYCSIEGLEYLRNGPTRQQKSTIERLQKELRQFEHFFNGHWHQAIAGVKQRTIQILATGKIGEWSVIDQTSKKAVSYHGCCIGFNRNSMDIIVFLENEWNLDPISDDERLRWLAFALWDIFPKTSDGQAYEVRQNIPPYVMTGSELYPNYPSPVVTAKHIPLGDAIEHACRTALRARGRTKIDIGDVDTELSLLANRLTRDIELVGKR